jgi:hypothetical protein
MTSRRAHQHPVLRAVFISVVCLVLTSSFPALSPFDEDETPSIVFRAPSWPLHALAENSPLRLEKQAQTQRFSLHKPHRNGLLTSAERSPAIQQRPQVRQRPARALPRRFLPSRHTIPRAPDDSVDPLLS